MTAHNLPHQSTAFVGRTQELTEIARILSDPACRLLTLLGAGGIGKTRLALRAAADQLTQFKQGVYFVPLTAVTSPDHIDAAIANIFQVTLSSPQDVRIQIIRLLRDKEVLLLLDNFEHLLEGAALFSDILQSAPQVKFLVTSRERLNLQEEWVLALEGLQVPDDRASLPLASYSAVQLFVQRARQVQANFSLDANAESVRRICQHVEGMPLGLELAASWLRAMPSAQIAGQIASRIDLLTTPLRNVPERHRSLRAVFEQSWKLLLPAEQEVMARLSTFRGGFDAEAAEAVARATLPQLADLVDKSLIRLNADGRYDLHELLRQYADATLNDTERHTAVQCHFDYFLILAEKAEAHQFGREQVFWFDRLEVELDNLRTALAWSLQNEEVETGLRLVAALGWFLCERAHWTEGLDWFERLFATNSDVPASLRSKALHSAGALAGMLGDEPRAETMFQQALVLARGSKDRWNTAWSLAHLGLYVERFRTQKMPLLEESVALFREIEDPMGLSHTLARSAMIVAKYNDFPYARALLEEASILAHHAGDKVMLAWVFLTRAEIFWRQDHNLEQTKAEYARCLSLFREARFHSVINHVLVMQGHLEHLTGNQPRAQALYDEALVLAQENPTDSHPENYFGICIVLSGLANIASARRQFIRAATLLGAVSQCDSVELTKTYPQIETFSEDVPVVRAQLSESDFAEAWAVGLAMTRSQMIAYARSSDSATEAPQNAALQPLVESLSARELEILSLIANGLTNAEIARQLFLTVGTVKVHTSNIYGKLAVKSRTQAVTKAQSLHLL